VDATAGLGANTRPLEVETDGILDLDPPDLSTTNFVRDVMVRGGTIRGKKGTRPDGIELFPSRLEGDLTLDGGATLENIRIEGPISGTGGLTIEGDRVLIEGEQVSTYQGVTQVTADSTLSLRHGSTLGATGVGNETVVEAGGALSLRTSENLADEIITLRGDLFSSRLNTDGPLEVDVTVAGDVKLTGRYARPIRGNGRLTIVDNTDLLAPMTFDGQIDIADRFVLEAAPTVANAYRVNG